MKIYITIIFVTLAVLARAQQLGISVGGVVGFSPNDFTIREAGFDFPSDIECESPLFLTVGSNDEWDKKTNPNRKWRIEVRKEDMNWNDAITLEIIRTGDGYWQQNNNSSHIENGTNYQVVNQLSNYFFEGKGLISDIPIQFRLSGFSIVNGANDYETNVVLTIYDN